MNTASAEDTGVAPPDSNVKLTSAFKVISGSQSTIHPDYPQEVIITKDQAWQRGGIWYKYKIDLQYEFKMEAYLYMGDKTWKNGGADGMTLTFHNDPRGLSATGYYGGGIGAYKQGTSTTGIRNALSLEIDTYYNNGMNDYDTGIPNTTLAHTALVIPTNPYGSQNHINLQTRTDDYFTQRNWIKLDVKWDPATSLFVYTIGDMATQTYSLDPMAVFNSSEVYWGFTGSTGSLKNYQAVAIQKLPQEPEGEIEKSVRNVTKNETTFQKETTADLGDELEYAIRIKNTDKSIVPYMNPKIVETLKDSEVVSGSFTLNGATKSDPVITNNSFTFKNGRNHGFGADLSIEPGEEDILTFRVKVLSGVNESKITNQALIQSDFSPEEKTNEVAVYVNPKITAKKTVDKTVLKWDVATASLNYQITITNDKEAGEWQGKVKDTLDSHLELVPGQTTWKKGTDATATILSDSYWQNSRNFESPQISLKNNESVTIKFTVKLRPTSWNAGQIVNQAFATGTNIKNQSVNAQSEQVETKLEPTRLYVRQVIANPVDDLVIPSTGYLQMSRRFTEDKSKEKSHYNMQVASGTNFVYPAFTPMNFILTSDSLINLVKPINPSFYTYIGYILTTDNAIDHSLITMNPSNQPVEIDYRANSEYYLTVFLQPTMDTPPVYDWNYRLNKLTVS